MKLNKCDNILDRINVAQDMVCGGGCCECSNEPSAPVKYI